jgi:hypothetical protein
MNILIVPFSHDFPHNPFTIQAFMISRKEAIFALKRNSLSCAFNRRIVTVSTHHIQIFGRQDYVSDLETDDSPTAMNSMDSDK